MMKREGSDMIDQLGQLACFDAPTREPIDGDLHWSDIEKGAHKGCGNPVAIETGYFRAYDVKMQQRICDDGIRWTFLSRAQGEESFRVKQLPRPWAEGEVLKMIDRSSE